MDDAIALVDAMLAAGWSYDEASHGFTCVIKPEPHLMLGPGADEHLWVSWQQAADMLAAAEQGHEVEAVEVEPTRREIAEMAQRVANEA